MISVKIERRAAGLVCSLHLWLSELHRYHISKSRACSVAGAKVRDLRYEPLSQIAKWQERLFGSKDDQAAKSSDDDDMTQ